MGYTLINRDDPSIESFRDVFFKIRRSLGTTAFGINELEMPAGFEGKEHDEVETGHEEVYIVLEGGGTFTVDGEVVKVVGGDYLRIDAGATRQAVAGAEGLRTSWSPPSRISSTTAAPLCNGRRNLWPAVRSPTRAPRTARNGLPVASGYASSRADRRLGPR